MSRLLRAVVFAAASLSILSPNALATSWGSPVTVAPAAGPISSSNSVVASDGAGKLTAIWSGDGASGYGVYSATRGILSTDAWSSPAQVAGTQGAPQALRLDVNPSGQAVAGWIDSDLDGDGSVTASRIVTVTRSAGGTWSAPTRLGETDPDHQYRGHELVVTPNGKAVGAWARATDADDYDAGAITQSASPAFSAGAVSNVSNGNGGSPLDLAVDGAGNATMLYLDTSGLGVYSSTRPAGGSWAAPQKVDQWTPEGGATGAAVAQPRIAVNDAGAAVATWLRGSESSSGLYASTRPAGGAWSAPVALQGRADFSFVSHSDVGIDNSGRATALWGTLSFNLLSASLDARVKSSSASAGGAWDAAQLRSTPTSTPYAGVELSVGANGDTAALWVNVVNDTFASIQGTVRRTGKDWEDWGRIADVAPNEDGAPLASIAVSPASEAVVVYATTRNVRAVSAALVDPPAPEPGPGTGTGTAPAPVPQSGPVPAPVIAPLPFVPGGTPTPPSGSTTDKKSVPQLKVVMYMVPRGKSCPTLAKGKLGKKTTKLRMRKVRKTIKKKRRTLCKVTGTIKVPSSTKVGTVYKIKVTAKRVKSKNVKIEVTDKNDD